MFGMHYKENFRNLRQLKKDRHPFKSRENFFISLEGKKKKIVGKKISDYDLHQYRLKLQTRLRYERKIFLLKMFISVILIFVFLYGLIIFIF